jgi:hypothetical protein
MKTTKKLQYAGADWVQDCLAAQKRDVEMSEFGQRVADLLGELFHGIYHIHKSVMRDDVDWTDERAIEIRLGRGLSTIDSNNLTRLLFLCHDRAIRAEIGPSSNRYFSVLFTAREHDAEETWARHPTLEEAVGQWREHHPAPQKEAIV